MTVDALQRSLFWTRRQMDQADHETIGPGGLGVLSLRSPVKETDNEDAAAVVPIDDDHAVLAVADGLGGHPAGDEAAEIALKTMDRCVRDACTAGESMRSGILDGFEQANHAVAELAVGAGTTLVAVEIDGSTIRPYHVGDSMILVVGQRGKIKLQTVAHSPVGYAQEAGLIDEHEAIHHEDRHLVSNIVGTPEMRIEIGRTLRLAARDTLLLATDGLFDNLKTAEIADLVRTGPIERVATRLAETSLERMQGAQAGVPSKPDDFTFIIFRPRDPGEVGG